MQEETQKVTKKDPIEVLENALVTPGIHALVFCLVVV
jgi:hypothetical protein